MVYSQPGFQEPDHDLSPHRRDTQRGEGDPILPECQGQGAAQATMEICPLQQLRRDGPGHDARRWGVQRLRFDVILRSIVGISTASTEKIQKDSLFHKAFAFVLSTLR